MQSEVAISFSYAIFSVLVDESRGQWVAVGVVLWSPERRWMRMRLAGEKETLKGLDPQKDWPLVRMVHDQVQRWIETGRLPHAAEPMAPYEDRWWRHVRELLVHRVRLSEPRPIDCRDPEQELEPLYEAVVAPHRASREQRTRIDGEITKCLKHLADHFKARQRIAGFERRDVQVMRGFRGARGWVVIEGVNLATTQAELQADATASKLMRLQAGLQEDCDVMIGYLASPEGLNGEKVLVDWLRERVGAKVFDLMKDRKAFLETADQLVEGLRMNSPPASRWSEKMNLYTCPACHCLSLACDSRAKAFLCNNRACNEAIWPPDGTDASGNPMALAITTGRVVVLQHWLDQQAKGTAARARFGS
jgi:hypothetical protein